MLASSSRKDSTASKMPLFRRLRPGPPLASIHRSAWNRNSRKFNLALPRPDSLCSYHQRGRRLFARAGALRGSGLYTVLGRAFSIYPILRFWRGLRYAPSPCCAESLVMRPCLSPVGRAQPLEQYSATLSCSAHRLLLWVGAPTGPSPGAPALHFAPSRCPKPYLTLTPAVLPIIPNRAGIPSTATHPHRDGACCTLFALLDRRVLERNYPER